MNLSSQLIDEKPTRGIASRLEAVNPLWIVVFGVYTQQFICLPKFDTPSGTMLITTYPQALPDRMRHIEESASRARSNDLLRHNHEGHRPEMNTFPAMEYLTLRRQPTQKLQDICSIVEELLSHRELLPAELHIKLDTFHADITVALEDRQDTDGTP